MHCQVLVFAELADALGTRELTVALPDGATVADALDQLGREHPVIATRRSSLAVAVSDAYRRAEDPLADGDTIALIPPVSGG